MLFVCGQYALVLLSEGGGDDRGDDGVRGGDEVVVLVVETLKCCSHYDRYGISELVVHSFS